MAEAKAPKGKKPKRKRKKIKKGSFYKGGKTERRFCSKCGAGVFMAEHKNRLSCGKCGYTEMKKGGSK